MKRIPIHLVNGFLDAGKTSFIQEFLTEKEFSDGKNALLILCEEGEEEYDTEKMQENHVTVITAAKEEFNREFLKQNSRKYRPYRIFVEMNCMWDNDWLFSNGIPSNMEICQTVTLVDASTFPMYLKNMRNMLSGLFLPARTVIFNRCSEDMDLQSFRRTVRGLNNQAELYFVGPEGEALDPGEEVLPYDINENIIRIKDEDFGIFYLDVFDHVERYIGKKVHFRAMIQRPPYFAEDSFVPGRHAMTCCANDIRFIGCICKYAKAKMLPQRQWIFVTARVDEVYEKEYRDKGPVMYLEEYSLTGRPKEDLVYFT